MSDTMSPALKKQMDEEKKRGEKIAFKYLATRKTMQRKDYADAVEALDASQEDWSTFDTLAVYVRKVTGKPWSEVLELTEGELEDLLIK